ncbi:sensor histidine kinase [Jiulongibacter sp. NS-SX5]|uniref:sensor histidine kinase n=1 Tax=Jiulongibacter sp. NS-SX5 TaxID=3463854 RepID=UPI0040583B58
MKNVYTDNGAVKRETRFEDRALYDAMSDGLVIMRVKDFELVYSNRAFESFDSDFERKKVIELLQEHIAGKISEDETALKGGYTKISVKNLILSDGEEGRVIVLIKHRDMPFREHYEILNESESQMGMGTWQYQITEDKLSSSKGMNHLFGYTTEDGPFAQNLYQYLDFVVDEDKSKITQALSQVVEKGIQVHDVEHRVIRKDKKIRLFSISTLRVLKENGNAYAIQGIIRDITELRQNEVDIADNIKKLNQSNDALSEFAYTASHDLQEPLRKIEAYGDRLKKSLGDELPERSSRYLDKMILATGRMSHLIEDILKLSRVSSANTQPEKVNLKMILDGIMGDYEESIRATKAVIKYDLPEVFGSQTQYHQLFQNLIGNSIKFRSEERTPTINITYAKASEKALEKVDLPVAVDYYEIVFKDNGIGFEQQFAKTVFAPFKRLFGRSEFPGTGIGLAIVKKIVENHGGAIRVESEEGVGTRFFIYLPKK